MLKPLLAASLLTLSFTAGATPTAPTPPGPPEPGSRPQPLTCTDGGDVIFEIDHKVEMGSPLDDMPQTSELKLYAGGRWAWTSGKQTASGCMAQPEMKVIVADLAKADWKFSIAEASCAAISSSYVQYSSHGKVVWAEHMCQAEYLNDKSRRSLDEIEKLLVTAAMPHTPPCCKK